MTRYKAYYNFYNKLGTKNGEKIYDELLKL